MPNNSVKRRPAGLPYPRPSDKCPRCNADVYTESEPVLCFNDCGWVLMPAGGWIDEAVEALTTLQHGADWWRDHLPELAPFTG